MRNQSRAISLLCFLFIFLLGKTGWATDRSILQAENSFSIGTGLTMINYAETLAGYPGNLDSESGNLSTTLLDWTGLTDEDDRDLVFLGIHVPPRTYLSGNFIYATGATSYDGATQTGIPVSTTNLSTFMKLNMALGRSFALDRYSVLIPTIVIGYHNWKRTVQPNYVFNGLSLENVETYSHSYLGLGAQIDLRVMEGEVVSFGIDLLENLNSNMSSTLTGDSYQLGNSMTVRLKAKITYEMMKNVNFFGRVDYEGYSYGISPFQADGSLEPDSKTVLTFYTVGVAYAY